LKKTDNIDKSVLKNIGMDKDELLKKVNLDFDEAVEEKNKTYKIVATNDKTESTSDYSQSILTVYKDWYDGNQWTRDVDGTTIDTSYIIAKPVINYIKTIIDQQVAMLKRRQVNFDPRPVESNDTLISVIWQNLLKYVWKKRYFHRSLCLGYQDSRIYGTGFGKVRWNLKDKDIDFVIMNPLDAYPDKYGLDIPDMRYIHFVFPKPKEYVKNMYGIEEKEDEVIIKETWYNPDVLADDGFYILWTDKNILNVRTLEDVAQRNEIPIVAFRPNQTTTSFWGASQVRDLAQIQKLHNKSLGLILDNLLLSNNGRPCTLDKNLELDNNPLSLIKLNSRDELWLLEGTNAVQPAWFSIVQYTSYSLAQALTGTYAVNLGGAAPTQTASGIISLQQAGSTLSESDLKDVGLSMSKLGKFVIDMIKNLYGKERIKKIIGEMKDIKDVQIDDLMKKFDQEIDLYVDFGESLPEDRLSRNNILLAMLQAGAITKEMYAQLSGIPELILAMDEKTKSDLEQAQKMMQQMQQAQPQTGTAGKTPAEQVAIPQAVNPQAEQAQTRVDNLQEKLKQGGGV
jgi:hypothetical protein